MKRTIFTISSEFASGGRLIGQLLAKELDIPFYDRKLIDMAAEKSGLSPEFIEKTEETATSSFLYSLAVNPQVTNGYFLHCEMPVGDKAFLAQATVIKELAEKGSCVIVGRCAPYILREDPDSINIFLYSTLEDKIERATSVYGMEKAGLAEKMAKIDKGRSNYCKYYTGEHWRNVHSYHMSLNTSIAGVEGTTKAIIEYSQVRK